MIRKLAFLLCLALALGLAGSNPVSGAALDLRIATGADDVEESVADHGMDLTSSDLEFPYDTSVAPDNDQVIGLRWVVPVPRGAKITKAYLEIECDQVLLGTQPVNVIIQGQLSPNAAPFRSATADLTSRPTTKAQVNWSIANYTAQNQKVQSPDLAALIQEIVDQPEWVAGNALVLSVRDDKSNPSQGLRESEAYEGEATAAPLLHLEVFIPEATKPDPANGAAGVTMPMFQWVAGEGAVAHNVYVGLKPELTEAELVGPKQPVNMFFYVPGLQPGVTYYWRVDEIDAAGKITPGTVWSFTAMPLTAWAPQPADGAKNVFPSQTLSWSAGQMMTQHQVFFSSNPFDVSQGAAAADKGKTAETKLTTGQLALKTTYYWRVDEIQADGKAIKGPVWSFRTADGLDIPIAVATDDVEEKTADNSVTQNSDLEMPFESAGTTKGTTPQVIGLRYLIPLAKGTQITKAYVEFTVDETKGGTQAVNLVIDGQLVSNALAFTTTAKDLTGRAPRTKAQVKWAVENWTAGGQKSKTPDLAALISEIISQDGWASGNALVLLFSDDAGNPSVGVRAADSREDQDSGAGTAAVLHIEVAGDQAQAAATADLRVASGTDDAEEHLVKGKHGEGDIDTGSSDLEMPYEDWDSAKSAVLPAEVQLIGMRWQVPLTKDMVVTKAYIEFILSETKGNTAPVNLIIEGQSDPNPLGFTTTAKSISSRPRTKAQVKWTVPTGLAVNDKFQTPDLSPIIKELLSQEGWALGNAVVFTVGDDKDNPSKGIRNAESFNTSSGTKAPLLHVEVLLP